jgi:hypothetical protein
LLNARIAAADPQDKADLKLVKQEYLAMQGRARRAGEAGETHRDTQQPKPTDSAEKLERKLDTALQLHRNAGVPPRLMQWSAMEALRRPAPVRKCCGFLSRNVDRRG